MERRPFAHSRRAELGRRESWIDASIVAAARDSPLPENEAVLLFAKAVQPHNFGTLGWL